MFGGRGAKGRTKQVRHAGPEGHRHAMPCGAFGRQDDAADERRKQLMDLIHERRLPKQNLHLCERRRIDRLDVRVRALAGPSDRLGPGDPAARALTAAKGAKAAPSSMERRVLSMRPCAAASSTHRPVSSPSTSPASSFFRSAATALSTCFTS